ncbi:hypothetical protein AVEN_210948-1 [Araneus ventricosus]|uniref:Uncharacterized protein n=1 Tax=Araneus ventricosus TaxID=182803 RepID=A0A4Y2DEY0_ARAVE|nr:hypothetical protein AVEN_210948-1 [Araneus ventricosus]
MRLTRMLRRLSLLHSHQNAGHSRIPSSARVGESHLVRDIWQMIHLFPNQGLYELLCSNHSLTHNCIATHFTDLSTDFAWSNIPCIQKANYRMNFTVGWSFYSL